MSMSPSDQAFQAKYGHAPTKAKTASTVKPGSRAEFEQLRQFKANHLAKLKQVNASHIEKTGVPHPVQPSAQTLSAKASKRARMLAEAKALHNAVQDIRADAGLTRISFDQAFFDVQFERLFGDHVLRVKASDPDSLKAAMAGLDKKPEAHVYKSPATLAKESRYMSTSQQQQAMNQALMNELRKL